MDDGNAGGVTVTLNAAEWQFLVTVLRASTVIMNTLMALERSMPGAVELPVSADAAANMVVLANRIEEQTGAAPTD